MSTNSLQFDLPAEQRPSVVPWIIVAVCAVLLVFLLSQLATRIPDTLRLQAQSIINPDVFPDVLVRSNGRNLALSGNVNVDQASGLGPLVGELMQIEGVRGISENIVVVDPGVRQRAREDQFARQLASIDFAGVDFTPGSTAFTPDSDAALAQVLQLLLQYPESRIRIEGHTDNTGADTVNLRVSRDRASAVANYLVARGVMTEQLIVTGYGSTQPIADNASEGGRARNRRIEINVVK